MRVLSYTQNKNVHTLLLLFALGSSMGWGIHLNCGPCGVWGTHMTAKHSLVRTLENVAGNNLITIINIT